MNSARGGQANTLNRRTLLSATGAGIGTLTLGGAGFLAAPRIANAFQFEATPPSLPEIGLAAPGGETIAEVAARLNYDAELIFAFVRDDIHYEAYAGVLRGAKGTLWARAGNAADQGVLLGELLTAAQIPWRFAIGQLDAAQAEALAANLTLTQDEAVSHYNDAALAAVLTVTGLSELPESPPAVSAEDQAALDRFDESSRIAIDLAMASTESSRSAIADALATANIDLPPLDPPSLPEREVNQHLWIQVSDGQVWIDYDPSIIESGNTSGPTSPVETLGALPDDWYHHLKIAIAADEYSSGSISRREAVSLATTSDRMIAVPIALSMASADELAGLGLAINELFTGQKTIFPTIYADGVTVDARQPLIFATDAGSSQDLLGSGTPVTGAGEGETLAVWLVVEISSPDESPVVIERALLDRIPADDRATGMIVAENIAPIRTVPTEIGDDTLEEFNRLTVIHTDVARMPPTMAFAQFGADATFGALGMLGPALAGFRDLLGMREETAHGYWSYPSAPNVTVFHVTSPTPERADTEATIAADLLYRQRTTLPLSEVAPSETVHPLVLSGVLDAVAEEMLLAPETRGESPDALIFTTGPSIGNIFAAATDAGLEIKLLMSVDDLNLVETDAASENLMRTALDSGQLIVAPLQPVDLDGEPAMGWWIVDPNTGRIRDQLQNGMSGASTTLPGRRLARLAQSGEYSFLTRAIAWIAARSGAFLCLGLGLAYAFFFSSAVIIATSGGPLNAGGVATATLGGAGAAAAAGGACI